MALIFRDASREDVPALVAMLADDPLGQGREGSDLAPYLAAYDEIAANSMHQLIVGVLQGRIVATCQLTILSGLSRQGAKRALVEAVRVAGDLRSQGIGEKLLAFCEEVARRHGCKTLQLTTSMERVHAHRFYGRIGYEHSHKGFKRTL